MLMGLALLCGKEEIVYGGNVTFILQQNCAKDQKVTGDGVGRCVFYTATFMSGTAESDCFKVTEW
jgi:hypothetical protein